MSDIRVFAVSKIGASHLKSGKPCQDSSLSWQSEDKSCSVVIAADGHGSDTYVRSDVGSRLVADITLSHIRKAIENPKFIHLMEGKRGAVTARPEGPRRMPKNPADRSESQQELIRQDQLFLHQVSSIREQDDCFEAMFTEIYKDWMDSIRKDSEEHPFTETEKTLFGNSKIEKAYGTTLLAFVRTPTFWMAFHLGDGKLLMADATGMWSEPVPWDCNCFLNMTTSLCNSDPVPCFRYAFDGTGKFPAAVVLGSDGMDDSWGTMDNLKEFYTKILTIFNSDAKEGQPFEQTVDELGEYLIKLSAQGSRDDMTMAGVIDMDRLDLLCQIADLRQKGAQLKNERDERIKELQGLQKKGEQELEVLQKQLNEELSALKKAAEHQVSEARKKAEEEFLQKKLDAEDKMAVRKKDISEMLVRRKEQIDAENSRTRELFEQLKEQADKLKTKALQSDIPSSATDEIRADEVITMEAQVIDMPEQQATDGQPEIL